MSSDWNEDERRSRMHRCDVGYGHGACGERATHLATDYPEGGWFCTDHADKLAGEGFAVEEIES